MADEPVLEAFSRRRKIEAKAVYFLARKGREILGQRCVLLKHFEPGHADNSGCHGQAERIAQQGIHACLAGTAAEKEFLTSNFHGDNAEILGVSEWNCKLFKATIARGVQGHLHTVEIVALNRGGQDLTISVAGHADEAREFLLAGLQESLKGAVRSFDSFEIVG